MDKNKLIAELEAIARSMPGPNTASILCEAARIIARMPARPTMPDWLQGMEADELALRMVAAGQCLVDLHPFPSEEERTAILDKLKWAFGIPDSVAIGAGELWAKRKPYSDPGQGRLFAHVRRGTGTPGSFHFPTRRA